MPKYSVQKDGFRFESRDWRVGEEFDALDTIEIRTHCALGNIAASTPRAAPVPERMSLAAAPVAPPSAPVQQPDKDESLFGAQAADSETPKTGRRTYKRRDVVAED